MANDFLGYAAVAVVGGIVGGFIATGPLAEATPMNAPQGRFQVIAIPGSATFARMDTATGQVVGCAFTRDTWPDIRCGITLELLRDMPATLSR